VPILVFIGLSVLDLGPMNATDRRQTASSLMPPPIRDGGIKINVNLSPAVILGQHPDFVDFVPQELMLINLEFFYI